MPIWISKTQVPLDKSSCDIQWNDGHLSRFNCKWLRFNCHCKICWPEFTAVYTIDVPSFPRDMTIEEASLTKNGDLLMLKIRGDIVESHVTELPASWLRSYCNCDECCEEILEKRDVISQHLSAMKGQPKVVPTADYSEIEGNEDSGLFKVAKTIVESGLCLIKNVPCQDKMILEVGKKFGPVLSSADSELYDVKVTNKVSGAYTELKLPMHQDQMSYETAPGVQLMHTLKFDSCITGGVSTVVDMFEVAQILREESPGDFQTFLEVPAMWSSINYEKETPIYLEQQKYHIVLDYFGKIVAVNWSPALATTVRIRDGDMERYYKAYCKFMEILRRESIQYKLRLQPGDLLMMNNRRVAHSRTAFQTNDGERHLQVSYISLCDLKSKYMILAHKLGIEVVAPKVGNSSSF